MNKILKHFFFQKCEVILKTHNIASIHNVHLLACLFVQYMFNICNYMSKIIEKMYANTEHPSMFTDCSWTLSDEVINRIHLQVRRNVTQSEGPAKLRSHLE